MPSLSAVLLAIFPNNIVEAFAKGNVTQIVVFGVFLGIATLWLGRAACAPASCHSSRPGASCSSASVGIIIAFAPIGLGVLTAYSVGVYGSSSPDRS